MSKGKRLRDMRGTAASQTEVLESADFSRKLAWADSHIDALDESMERWFKGGAYTLVDKPDPKTGYHVLYAKIKKTLDPNWPLIVGDAVHNLRSALDHIAFSMLATIYDGSIPDALARGSEFPVVGSLSRAGKPRGDPDADFSSIVARTLGTDFPEDAREALRDLQPYKRGSEFGSHEIWLIHDLDRIDKHRHLHLMASVANLTQFSMGGTGYFPYFWFGGGETKDGDKVAEWAEPTGPCPNLNVDIACQIVLGQPEAGAGREPVSLLRGLRAFLDSDVIPALAPFL